MCVLFAALDAGMWHVCCSCKRAHSTEVSGMAGLSHHVPWRRLAWQATQREPIIAGGERAQQADRDSGTSIQTVCGYMRTIAAASS